MKLWICPYELMDVSLRIFECVLTRFCKCPHAVLNTSFLTRACVLTQIWMRPHTFGYVSSWSFECVLTQFRMCPYTVINVSLCKYECVLMGRYGLDLSRVWRSRDRVTLHHGRYYCVYHMRSYFTVCVFICFSCCDRDTNSCSEVAAAGFVPPHRRDPVSWQPVTRWALQHHYYLCPTWTRCPGGFRGMFRGLHWIPRCA